MSQVGFEPTILAFEQAKTVHALDRVATVIGTESLWRPKFFFKMQTYKSIKNILYLTKVRHKIGIRFILKY
jgi:hypothetical protein